MKERFADAKAGDKVYDRVYGFGKVSNITPLSANVYVLFSKVGNTGVTLPFCKNGNRFEYSAEPTLFYVDGDNKYATERPVPKVPWGKVPVDTKVILLLGNHRHYAGKPTKYFNGGVTSWTNDVAIRTDTGMSLGEEITIDGVTYPAGSK